MRRQKSLKQSHWIAWAGCAVLWIPAIAAAEGHYSKGDRNCRVDATISLPRNLTKTTKRKPAWPPWRLRAGTDLISVQQKTLKSYSPTSGIQISLDQDVPEDVKIQAGVGPTGVYTITAPRLGGISQEAVSVRGYASDSYNLLWSVNPFSEVTVPTFTIPVATDKKLFIGAGNRITALNVSNGKKAWSRTLDAFVGSNAALSGQTVILLHSKGIDAVSLGKGKKLWRHTIDSSDFRPSRPLTLSGGRVYVPLGERTVSALNLKNGNLIWESSALPQNVDFRHPIVVDASGISVPITGGLARLSLEGTLLWSKSYSFLKLRQVDPAVLATTEALFVGGTDGLFAVSPESGAVLWSKEGLGQIASIEYLAPDLIAVNSRGTVYAFAP